MPIDDRFKKELQELINRHGIDAALDTPDFIIADYLWDHVGEMVRLLRTRDNFYARHEDRFGTPIKLTEADLEMLAVLRGKKES